MKWYSELSFIEQIKIPRTSFGQTEDRKVEIHTFCDASKGAYAAVVFARITVKVQLLAAKFRLAPLVNKKKTITINRLELMGCVIGARLANSVRNALTDPEVRSYFWSDSSTVLAWIRREADWGTFVGNRTLSKKENWNHVPGVFNPADLPSRGCLPSQLLTSTWWEGPDWLKKEESAWPVADNPADEKEVDKERRKTANVALLAASHERSLNLSSYLKNVRAAAYVRRFIINCKTEKSQRIKNPALSIGEMKAAEVDLLRQVQRSQYPEKPILKNLEVVRNEGSLLHVKTKLSYREDADLFREPILLPRTDPLVHQLIMYVHKSNCYAGTQVVLGKLRERYWIPQGRKTVGSVIRKCVKCQRYSGKNMSPAAATLPKDRVENQFAFQTTGVHLAGPLILRGGKKTWIVLYTCALYRGVYLDIVDLLSADEFLDSLEKFTNIVGRPNRVYSDNGTNFVRAQNLLKRLDWEQLEQKLAVKQIVWKFNPPAAPWWGGWWERLVRSVKELLRRMLGTARLTRKELASCSAAVSATINSRPLTTLTEDVEDLNPLTPDMFMRDLPVTGLPERELLTGKDLQGAYKKIRNLKRSLQERFRKEYLSNLVQMKNEKKQTPHEVGDIVLVGADNKKRFEWPFGRILELVKGADQKIRVAKVKTANGILTRPLQRLYLLEVTQRSVLNPTEKYAVVKVPVQMPNESIEKDAKSELLNLTRSGREVKKPSRNGQWNS